MTARGAVLWIAGFLAVAFLPVAASSFRGPVRGRCETDGLVLAGRAPVRIVDAERASHDFCSVRCAASWITRNAAGRRDVFVADDVTGTDVPSQDAWFVWSRVAAPGGDGIRAFRRREDAAAHAATFGGEILEGARRPFPPAESQ